MTKVSAFNLTKVFCVCAGLAMGSVVWAPVAVAQDAQTHMIRGVTALEVAESDEDFRDARREFERAARLEPDWSAPQFNLGVVHEALKDYARAKRHYERYLELEPSASDALEVRAKITRLEYLIERQDKRERSGAWLVGGTWRVEIYVDGGWIPAEFTITFRQGGGTGLEVLLPMTQRHLGGMRGFAWSNEKWIPVTLRPGQYQFDHQNTMYLVSGKRSITQSHYQYVVKRASDDLLDGERLVIDAERASVDRGWSQIIRIVRE